MVCERWPVFAGASCAFGTAQPIVVTVTAGSDVQQDVLMSGSAQPLPLPASTWTAPAALPPAEIGRDL